MSGKSGRKGNLGRLNGMSGLGGLASRIRGVPWASTAKLAVNLYIKINQPKLTSFWWWSCRHTGHPCQKPQRQLIGDRSGILLLPRRQQPP